MFNGSAIPAQSPGPAKTRQVPRAPLRTKGVTSCAVASCTKSEGTTPPSSLIRPHASDQNPPAASGCPLVGGSLQVAASPCWEMALPDVISADLSLGAWTPTPQCSPGAHARFFPEDNGLTSVVKSSAHQTLPIMQLQPGILFRGCSSASGGFRLPCSLDPQVAPTAEA